MFLSQGGSELTVIGVAVLLRRWDQFSPIRLIARLQNLTFRCSTEQESRALLLMAVSGAILLVGGVSRSALVMLECLLSFCEGMEEPGRRENFHSDRNVVPIYNFTLECAVKTHEHMPDRSSEVRFTLFLYIKIP